ncbi:MAG: outer membrane beta-barrel protein [Alphaproteobacteria bacterium]|nr:outer membrane beta-barrel protein [Alphaproteobacteria bacterium]NCQ66967.1 outer membrane beta-barrel protein [Alphaproteobacteria bacterium]NCT07533.1 outer membrane beta-barrel protein [Alphaproteobacteria bacterium]
MAKKTLLLLIICSSFMTVANANWRFYGSLGAGFHVRQDTFQSLFSLDGVDDTKKDKKTFKRIGFVSEYALGTQKNFNAWGLATEVFFNYNNSERSHELSEAIFIAGVLNQTPIIKTNQKKSFGIRGLVQLPVSTCWTLMAGADLLWTHFNIDLQTLSSTGDDTLSGHKKEYTPGIAPTIGAEFKMNETLSIRGTYAYQIHRNIKIRNFVQSSSPDINAAETYIYKATLKPRAHVLKLNLVIYI